MKALCWFDTSDVRVVDVPDPSILSPKDAIIKVGLTAICGSDLHLYDGMVPGMRPGDILGHEMAGEVVEVGGAVENFHPGDRVVVAFPISCGKCYYCEHEMWSLCDNSNPNASMAELLYGYSPSGIYGYSHLFGGYAGGQAEYVRVPFADTGLLRIPESMDYEKALFLSDVFPTGYMAADNCSIKPGDSIAIWGCGPVGQFAIRSAFLLGAEKVIAVDRFHERLEMAQKAGALVIDYEDSPVYETLLEMTAGRGPDACIDAVGMEAHGTGPMAIYDKVKTGLNLETDRPTALREIIRACRKGGTISIPGVYGGYIDKMPMGAVFNKSLTIRTGQTLQKYMPRLLDIVQRGELDPTFVITHRLSLDQAPKGYEIFKKKKDGCVKVVLSS